MLLVPLRHWALPRFFRQPRHLQDLDAAQEEEAAALTHEQALQVRQRSRQGQPCASFCWLGSVTSIIGCRERERASAHVIACTSAAGGGGAGPCGIPCKAPRRQ
jgi:hypothetical protein